MNEIKGLLDRFADVRYASEDTMKKINKASKRYKWLFFLPWFPHKKELKRIELISGKNINGDIGFRRSLLAIKEIIER